MCLGAEDAWHAEGKMSSANTWFSRVSFIMQSKGPQQIAMALPQAGISVFPWCLLSLHFHLHQALCALRPGGYRTKQEAEELKFLIS